MHTLSKDQTIRNAWLKFIPTCLNYNVFTMFCVFISFHNMLPVFLNISCWKLHRCQVFCPSRQSLWLHILIWFRLKHVWLYCGVLNSEAAFFEGRMSNSGTMKAVPIWRLLQMHPSFPGPWKINQVDPLKPSPRFTVCRWQRDVFESKCQITLLNTSIVFQLAQIYNNTNV